MIINITHFISIIYSQLQKFLRINTLATGWPILRQKTYWSAEHPWRTDALLARAWRLQQEDYRGILDKDANKTSDRIPEYVQYSKYLFLIWFYSVLQTSSTDSVQLFFDRKADLAEIDNFWSTAGTNCCKLGLQTPIVSFIFRKYKYESRFW